MFDETCSSKSGLYIGQLREWSKKKSTDERLDEEEPKAPTTQSTEKVEVTNVIEDPPTVFVEVEPDPTPAFVQSTEELPTPQVEEPQTPRVISSSSGKKETPSLYRKKEEKKEEEQTSLETKEEHYTDEAVETVWKEFAEHRIEGGAGDAEKLVLGRKMDNKEGNDIVIHLGSQLEMTILAKIEQELVQYLRKGLQNDLILLKKEVAEQQATQKLYTSQDKYDHMLEKNPALKTLKEKLGLDFEY